MQNNAISPGVEGPTTLIYFIGEKGDPGEKGFAGSTGDNGIKGDMVRVLIVNLLIKLLKEFVGTSPSAKISSLQQML